MLLILDFTIGLTLLYQFDQGNLSSVNPNICEEGKLYSLWGVKWENFPIRYYLDSSIPNSFIEVIEDSFDIWDDISSNDLFQKENSIIQSNLLISFSETSGQYVLGETSVYEKIKNSGIISSSTLILSPSKDWEILDFSCKLMPINHPGPYDIQSVMVHELGHVLGLDHTRDEFTTMHDYYIGTFQKTLSQGDIDGFYAIYGS